MRLTVQQKRFFDDFGYIFLPGLMAEEAGWIIEEYEKIFRDSGIVHDGTKRSSIGPFIERNERLCTLLDNPKVDGLFASLIGDDYMYHGSGADLYVGDGMWHPDCHDAPNMQLKWAMYLDPLTKDTGALRVVPGSHKQGWIGNLDTQTLWGIPPEEVPCDAPDNTPGDVTVFNLATLHNSLKGGNRRRMLNMGTSAHCKTEEERRYMRRRLPRSVEDLRWDLMLKNAPPGRMRHLQPTLDLINAYAPA